jgi:hypothetical protein
VATLLVPIGVLASFDHWSLQYIFDGFAVPPDVARDVPAWSFWGQVAIFWTWGLSLAVATAAYAREARRCAV